MSARTPRRFPLAVLAAAAMFLLWLWLLSSQIRQMQVIFTYATILLGGLALLIWWAVAGSGSRRARLAPLLLVACAAAIFAATFRVKGITGDWLPVVEPRFGRHDATGDRPRAGAEPDAVAGTGAIAATESFPRFLGPDGDSTIRGVRLARDWTATPPRLLWQRPVGAGWSGFAIAGGRAFTLEQRGEMETVAAYDLATGDELWSHGERAFFTNPMAGPGPRATPTIDGDRLFTFGSTGLLGAYDAATGRLLWQHDVPREHDATIPEHGMTGSPLVVDGLVVVSAGGPGGHSLVAYRADGGELAWHGGDDGAGYASPRPGDARRTAADPGVQPWQRRRARPGRGFGVVDSSVAARLAERGDAGGRRRRSRAVLDRLRRRQQAAARHRGRRRAARGSGLGDAAPQVEVREPGVSRRLRLRARRRRAGLSRSRPTARDDGRAAATATAICCWWATCCWCRASAAR